METGNQNGGLYGRINQIAGNPYAQTPNQPAQAVHPVAPQATTQQYQPTQQYHPQQTPAPAHLSGVTPDPRELKQRMQKMTYYTDEKKTRTLPKAKTIIKVVAITCAIVTSAYGAYAYTVQTMVGNAVEQSFGDLAEDLAQAFPEETRLLEAAMTADEEGSISGKTISLTPARKLTNHQKRIMGNYDHIGDYTGEVSFDETIGPIVDTKNLSDQMRLDAAWLMELSPQEEQALMDKLTDQQLTVFRQQAEQKQVTAMRWILDGGMARDLGL